MDTQLLRTFVTVAEYKGFSAAAKVLHKTQSAISLQVMRLEDLMGESLLKRSRRKVELTAAGNRLLPYARHILKLESEARQEMEINRQGELIRLGITEEKASIYLSELVTNFSQRYPSVRLEITCGVSSHLVKQFQEGFLDVVLGIRHAPTKTGQLISTEKLIWVMSEECPIDEWDTLPLSMNPDGCIFRAHAIAALGRAEFKWNVRYTSLSPSGINIPVINGLAITIKTPRSIPEGCIEVPEDLGLPALGLVEVELHCSPSNSSIAYEEFCTMLTKIVSSHENIAKTDYGSPFT